MNNRLLKFIMLAQRKTYNINDSVGIKSLARLRLDFSHQHERKFRHGFIDISNPFWSCSIKAETTTYYFLLCHFYDANKSALMNDLNKIDSSFSRLNDNNFIVIISNGSDKLITKRTTTV